MGKNKKVQTAKAIDDVLHQVSTNPTYIQSLLETLDEKSTARFQAAKKLQLISQGNPSLLYSHFDTFAKLLDSTSSVLLWNAIIILSYLASIDSDRRFDSIIDRYYGHLWDGKLVTAANILGNSGRIARCRPDLAKNITTQLLKADVIPLPTAECREVARGAVLSSFAEYLDTLSDCQPALNFIVRCKGSHRPAVKKQAEELLKRINRS